MIAAELRGGNKPSLNDALGWIGSRVDDIYGTGVGRLEDVWIDPGTGAPKWLLVKEGRFGGRTTLIPFEDATAGAGHVWIPYERDVVRDAPAVTPGAPLTQAVETALRAHYSNHSPTTPRQPQGQAVPAPAAHAGYEQYAHQYQLAQDPQADPYAAQARRPLPPSPPPIPPGAALPPRPSQIGRSSQLAAVSGATAPRHLAEQPAPPPPRARYRAPDPRQFQPRPGHGPYRPPAPVRPPVLEHEGPGYPPQAHFPAPQPVPPTQVHHLNPPQQSAPPQQYPAPHPQQPPPAYPQQPVYPAPAPAPTAQQPQAPRLRPQAPDDGSQTVAIPLVQGLDQPYRVEIALTGELRVSGELKSFSIQPTEQREQDQPADPSAPSA